MRRLGIGAAFMFVAVGAVLGQANRDREKSVAVFKQIAQVMRSPRCMTATR
jgi:hypothetical protein